MKLDLDIEEIQELIDEGGHGFCRNCNEESDDYIDPDGRNCKCESCGEDQVFGLYELILMGEL